jgi:hypothetical protein
MDGYVGFIHILCRQIPFGMAGSKTKFTVTTESNMPQPPQPLEKSTKVPLQLAVYFHVIEAGSMAVGREAASEDIAIMPQERTDYSYIPTN